MGVRNGQPRFSPQQRAERRARMLKTRVGLNDATAKNVVSIMAKYDAQRRAFRKNLRDHHEKLVALVESDSNDQAAYRRELLALKQGRIAMMRLRDLQIAEIQRVLTPKQQAKLLVQMGKFRRMMRHGGRRHGPHGRRGRGNGNMGQQRGNGRGWR